MKIAVDAKRLFNNLSGLGVYSRALMSGLIELFPKNEYALKVHKKHFKNSSFATGSFSEYADISNALIPAYWRTFELGVEVEKEKYDIFHGLSNELPKGGLNKVKKIVTIHDLIAYKHPEWFSMADAKILKAKVEHVVKKADRIIVPSDFVKRDIDLYFTGASPKTFVVREAVEITRNGLVKSPFSKFVEEPNDFFLFVGNTNPRKNLSLVLEAITLFPEAVLIAVLGNAKPKADQKDLMEKLMKQNRLILFDYLNESELKYLYRYAKGLIYPSIEEGFGLPVLEAMHNNCPVVTTSNSAMSEITADAAIYINSNDKEELKVAMIQLMDSTIADSIIEKANMRVDEFTIQRMARETNDIYLS